MGNMGVISIKGGGREDREGEDGTKHRPNRRSNKTKHTQQTDHKSPPYTHKVFSISASAGCFYSLYKNNIVFVWLTRCQSFILQHENNKFDEA